ncbi:MAG: N-acetyltransferase [Rickettsiales bacterium]|nr:N-acetyltransferase [Rickettsiales bacterium]
MDRRDYLNESKNPFFEHATCAFWIARDQGRDVGRIAAVHDVDWEKHHGDKVGYFGMFDAANDPQVAEALIGAARSWLQERGLSQMIGPMDLSTNYMAGLLIEGFDSPPGMQMPYNPAYYEQLIEGCGLSKVKDLWQWYLSTDTPIPDKVSRVADKIRKRSRITVRPMDLGRWDQEVGRVIEIYNDAWDQNWGFVPVGEREFRHIAADLKMVLRPELALMAEVDGEPVAFSIAVMNINPLLKKLDGKLFPFGLLRLLWDLKVRPKVRDCRLIVLGIKSGFRRRGIDSILFVDTHRAVSELGWDGGELGWTLEDNDMVNRAIESMQGEKIKNYRVYGVDL